VNWGPLALVLGDIIVVGHFTSHTSPSEPLWYVDVVITTAAFLWVAVGLLRYRPTPEVASPAVTAEILEPAGAR
jgi:hypothetical protein